MTRSRRREALDRRWAEMKATGQRTRLLTMGILAVFAIIAVVVFLQTREPNGPFDVNKASAAELESLPGIGPVMAEDIINGRPYQTAGDLDRVKGIGPATIEKLRPHLTFPEGG